MHGVGMYVNRDEFRSLFWSHCCEEKELLTRLYSLPEGLSWETSRQRSDRKSSQKLEGSLSWSFSEYWSCLVKRAGESVAFHRVPWSRVVTGDIIRIMPGEICWADVRILHCWSPSLVDESMLRDDSDASVEDKVRRLSTLRSLSKEGIGEVVAWSRDVHVIGQRQLSSAVSEEGTAYYAARNVMWSGTVLLRGYIEGVVVNVGQQTLADMFCVTTRMRSTDELAKTLAKASLKQYGVVTNYRWSSNTTDLAARLREHVVMSAPLCLHWKSPMLRYVTEQTDAMAVEEIYGGLFLDRLVPAENPLLEHLKHACVLLSLSSLSLADMKQWTNGELKIEKVKAEGAQEDVIGTNMQRWALSQLGGKTFWKYRSNGVKVYKQNAHSLIAFVSKDVCFLRCSLEEAKEICTHYMEQNGEKRVCKSQYWKTMKARVHEVTAENRMYTIVVKLPAWDEQSMPKDGVVLGLLAFQEAIQTLQQVKEAIQMLRGAKVEIVLRCYGQEELERAKEKGEEIGLWSSQRVAVYNAYEYMNNDGDTNLLRMREAQLFMFPRKGVHEAEFKKPPPAPEQGVEAAAQEEEVVVTRDLDGQLPLSMGLFPLATSDTERSFFWDHIDAPGPLQVIPRHVGDRGAHVYGSYWAKVLTNLSIYYMILGDRNDDIALSLFIPNKFTCALRSDSSVWSIGSNVLVLHHNLRKFIDWIKLFRFNWASVVSGGNQNDNNNNDNNNNNNNKCSLM